MSKSKKKAEEKAEESEEKKEYKEAGKVERAFHFPLEGKTIKAASLEEAMEKLNKS